MRINRSLIIIILWLCSLNSAYAVVIKDLYQAAMPVSSQSSKVRKKVLPLALKQVLVKVSGNPAIGTVPDIQDKLATAASMLQQYSYYLQPSEDNPNEKQTYARFSFEPNAVRQLLSGSGQGVWSAQRPLLTTWVAVQTANGEQHIISDDDNQLVKILEADAEARGLPIAVPMLDISDMNQVTFKDVQQENINLLQQASKRYAGNGMLLGQVTQQPDNTWQGHWRLYLQDEPLSWDVSGASAAEVVQHGIDNVADQLANQYAILAQSTNQNVAELRVSDIRNVTDYAKVLKYLRKLSPVKEVEIVSVSPGEVIYKLTLVSGSQALVRSMTLSPVLKPIKNVMADEDQLHYRLGS